MFEQKEKEPKLSQHMQDIISRCLGEKSDANTDEIMRLKRKIIDILTSCDDLVNTLHIANMTGDSLRDVCIFDYMRLPSLKDEIKNYVCFEVYDNSGNGAYISKRIVFRTVSHVEDIKTDWGVSRQDLLASIIKTSFDWTNALGMTCVKVQDTAGIGDEDYYYREITYEIRSSNNLYDKVNGYRRT